MDKKVNILISMIISSILSSSYVIYMLKLRVPSVLEIRPELTDVSLMTGIFSGRGGVYLYYHYPIPMGIITGLFAFLVIYSMTYDTLF